MSADVWRVPAARGDATPANGGLTIQLLLVREGRGESQRLWLVGSGPTPVFAAKLACAITALLGRQPSDVINTRAAPELAMGNIAFEPARIWALPEVKATMEKRCQMCQDKLRAKLGPLAGASLLPAIIRTPSQAVTSASLGPFEWTRLDRAKGEEVLVLRHRPSGLVLAQGLLWAGDVPDLQRTHSETLLTSWQALARYTGQDLTLGEQGEPERGGATLLAHGRYVAQLRAAVWAQLAAGQSLDVQSPALALPEFAPCPSYGLRHPINIQQLWRELEPQLFLNNAASAPSAPSMPPMPSTGHP